MTEKCLIGNPQHDLSGTLFTRCFWYTIISVLTRPLFFLASTLALYHSENTEQWSNRLASNTQAAESDLPQRTTSASHRWPKEASVSGRY